MKTVFVAVALVALLAGCASPKSQELPADLKTASEDTKFVAAVRELQPEDRELLTGYMLRSALGQAFGGVGGGAHTIGEAIEVQKKWKAEAQVKQEQEKQREAAEKALAAKVQAEQDAARDAMSKAVTVAVVKKVFLEHDYSAHQLRDLIGFEIAFANTTGRDISGVKGEVNFADMFGDKVKGFNISVDETIPAGQAYVWRGTVGYNQFMAADKKLASTDLEKLKVQWIPEKVLMTDGTKMDVPELAMR